MKSIWTSYRVRIPFSTDSPMYELFEQLAEQYPDAVPLPQIFVRIIIKNKKKRLRLKAKTMTRYCKICGSEPPEGSPTNICLDYQSIMSQETISSRNNVIIGKNNYK